MVVASSEETEQSKTSTALIFHQTDDTRIPESDSQTSYLREAKEVTISKWRCVFFRLRYLLHGVSEGSEEEGHGAQSNLISGALDNGPAGSRRTGTATVFVEVQDVNDNRPIFLQTAMRQAFWRLCPKEPASSRYQHTN
ncbi:hypothetical protein WMY93_018603 [Mugilogobius chulae]|uniref:Cadherin domain-containing protein n=1 Tax=Mugilogobius chulae TaxID=88201 RepID=A0AAW0NNN1_9GOBI